MCVRMVIDEDAMLFDWTTRLSRIHLHVLQPRDRPLALRTTRVVPLEHARRAEAARGVAAVKGRVLLPVLEADGALALLGEPRGHQLPRDGGEPDLHVLRERVQLIDGCLLYTSPSPRDRTRSRMPSSA